MTNLIKILDKLMGVAKELLDICCEQAKIIEQNDLISADQTIDRQRELESFREILSKAIGG